MARISVKYSLGAGLLASALASAALAQAPAASAPAPAAAAPAGAPQTPAAAPVAAAPAAPHAPAAAGKGHASKPAVAPIALEKPLWKDLTPVQQRALEPLAGEWNKLEGLRKQKWLEIANRYNAMKPDEQARVQERMRDWVRLTPDQRRMVRENFARSQKVAPTPGQKSAQWQQYQQLPEAQKKLLADKAPKKQVANPPSPTQSKIQTVPPVKRPTTGAPAPVAGAAGAAGAVGAAGAASAAAAPPAPAPAGAVASPATGAAASSAAAASNGTPPAANVK